MTSNPTAEKYKKKILNKTKPEKDTLQETPAQHMRWSKSKKGLFEYPHGRDLRHEDAQKALDYISEIVKSYPFQIRYAMAIPLWKRFCDEWCNTGDLQRALRVI